MPADVVQTDEFATAVQGPAGGDARTATSVRAMGSPLASRTRWTWNRLQRLMGMAVKVTSVDATTDVLHMPAHPFADDEPLYMLAVGDTATFPGNTSGTTLYYAQYNDADSIKLRTTPGGSAVDLSTAGSPTIYAFRMVDAAAALWTPASGILPGGTIRTQLDYLRDNYGRLLAANSWAGVQTLTVGGLAFSGTTTWTGIKWRYEDSLTDVSQTIQLGITDEYVLPAPGGARTYTVSITTPAPSNGARLRISRPASGAFDISIQRTGAALIATLPASTACGIDLIVRGGVVRGSLAGAGAVPEASW